MRAALIAVTVMACCYAADPIDEVRAAFTYHGSPIHAGIVEMLSSWMSDSPEPQILAIDLSTSQKSNRFDEGSSIRDETGWVRTRRRDPDDRSTFGYRFIGSLPSGTIVLHAYEEGGGSGTFESVMLLAAGSEPAQAADGTQRARQVLRVIRTIPIGDRARAAIGIAGSTIRVDRANAHDPDQRGPITIEDPQRPAAAGR